MKNLTVLILGSLVCSSSFAGICNVSINGTPLVPVSLSLGEATVLNENGNQSVEIQCGKFDGILTPVNRVQVLQPRECTLVSNGSEIKAVYCHPCSDRTAVECVSND